MTQQDVEILAGLVLAVTVIVGVAGIGVSAWVAQELIEWYRERRNRD